MKIPNFLTFTALPTEHSHKWNIFSFRGRDDIAEGVEWMLQVSVILPPITLLSCALLGKRILSHPLNVVTGMHISEDGYGLLVSLQSVDCLLVVVSSQFCFRNRCFVGLHPWDQWCSAGSNGCFTKKITIFTVKLSFDVLCNPLIAVGFSCWKKWII